MTDWRAVIPMSSRVCELLKSSNAATKSDALLVSSKNPVAPCCTRSSGPPEFGAMTATPDARDS